jgi:hypothetical protein
MKRCARFAALSLLLLLVIGAARASAQPAPYHHWRTLATAHFNVHVSEGLEREGRVAGAAAERAYAQLSRELVPPRGLIDLVVSDDADYSNGYATPFPSPRIVVFATPPVENAALRLNEDWLGLVITHELTHIFHLDRVRGPWATAQSVFGRAPLLFPNIYEPAWITEGLAVYYESRLTEGGRLHDAEHRVIARNAAREGVLPQLGDLSEATPRFPNGNSVYAYGSLFIDYLARTRGDSTVGRFVEAGSEQLNPFALGRSSRAAFGITFDNAFHAWRDSLYRSSARSAPPLPGWRDLSTEGYYASAPRWLNDSTIVYTSSDGRTGNAAYTITTSGKRTRIARRNSDGANVPLPDGGLLYAQIEYVGTSEVRSDLYVERSGRVTRLTHGARLIQPDVRKSDGTIVAVRLDAGRSSLVLLDRDGQLLRVLREAGPDETWSEPRFAPGYSAVAAVHRTHGGTYSIEIVSLTGNETRVAARGSFLLSSPEWSYESGTLFYVSERSGTPRVEAWDGLGVPLHAADDSSLVAISSLAASPNGGRLAGIVLRADGYHVGVAPMPKPILFAGVTLPPDSFPSAAAQPFAVGDYTDYSAWPSLRPRYWLPIIESAPDDGIRLGATTSGYDVLGRHSYSAYAEVPTSGRFYTGGLAYRYSALRRPLFDFSISQDWTNIGAVATSIAGGVQVAGTLFERKQDISLSATYYQPHIRTASSLTFGVGAERRNYATGPEALIGALGPGFAQDYTDYRALVGASWRNYQRPLLSISPEDGVALAFTARERLFNFNDVAISTGSVVGTVAAYRSLNTRGFAHSVVALRVAGGISDANALSAFEVGGTSGTEVALLPGYTVGEGRHTFGVRGFPEATIYGTSAAAASLEYRVPLLLGGIGSSAFPAFFDRSSVSIFGDAGTAGCIRAPLFAGVCAPAGVIGRTIASVGAELGVSGSLLLVDAPILMRLGFAVPVVGRTIRPVQQESVYAGFGFAF